MASIEVKGMEFLHMVASIDEHTVVSTEVKSVDFLYMTASIDEHTVAFSRRRAWSLAHGGLHR